MNLSGLLALEAADRAAVFLGGRFLKLDRTPEVLEALRAVYDVHFELGSTTWAASLPWASLSRNGCTPCRLHPGQDQDDCTFCGMLDAS